MAALVHRGLVEGNVGLARSLLLGELRGEKTEKLGLTKTPLLISIGRELGKMMLREKWMFEEMLGLWSYGGREERLVVIGALEILSRRNYGDSKRFVLSILNDIHGWEICDQLALRVVVNLAIQNREEMFRLMEGWVESENKWVRRLAVAAIPPYIRRRTSESNICLELLDKAMMDGDRDVVKAVGWALREISKKNSGAVFSFLVKWAESCNRNSIRIIREGMKKLAEEQQEKLRALMGGCR